jgi:simple sugar transport system permease protein
MNERSGIVNIGIEGMMLTSAFVGFMAAVVVSEAMPATPGPIFGITPALIVGLLAAVGSGMLVSALHAWLSISVRADQIISGTVINITALGLTAYLNRLIRPSGSAGTFDVIRPPEELLNLPIVGWIFRMFLTSGPITTSVIILVVILQILLFRSRWGLRTRAVGEHPRAADTVGIDVIRVRYRNVILGGVFAGLAGAWLTLEFNASFQNGMTANRGFIALAAVIFGRWTPIGAFGGALLFMVSEALGIAIRSNPPPGDLGVFLSGVQSSFPSIYNNFFGALPYLLTLIVLAGVVGRSVPPAAVGRPYVKEGAS